MSLITRSEYARRRGVDPALVTRWAKADRLVVVGKLIDAEKSDALLAQSMDPARGGKGGKSDRQPPAAAPAPAIEAPPQRSTQPDTYTRVRTHREAFAAKMGEAQYRKMVGELIERDEMRRGLFANLGPSLQRLDNMDVRLAARLAAETDERKCGDMVREEAQSIRQEIADYAQALIDGVGKTKQ